MDTIQGLPESVEDPSEFAASIVARDESLAILASVPSLGPPDLCWLQKSAKGSWSSAAAAPRGYYHYVLGQDVSSSAAVAAHFAKLTANVEPIGLLQGLWYSAETKIERGFYCSFDPFTRLDVRCELCIPGGVVCGALDSQGAVHEVTPEVWKHLQLASFLRHELYDADLTSHTETLARYDPLPSPEAEAKLLQIIHEMYAANVLPGCLELVTQDLGCGCTAEHSDLVLFTLFHYFGRQHRWTAALEFMQNLSKVHSGAALYIAAAQRELEGFDESFQTLTLALEVAPDNAPLLVALANECLYGEQLEMAIRLARRAVRLRPSLRPAWIVLARCYVRMGLYSLALITLNVTPPPPLPGPEQEMLLITPPTPPASVTKPSHAGYDVELESVKQMTTEESSTDGSQMLQCLPGAVMVNREPLDLGAWPDLAPSRSTRAVLGTAYGILQELVAAVGWDTFLEMRARVFVMHEGHGSSEQIQHKQAETAHHIDQSLEQLAALGLTEHPEEARLHRQQQSNGKQDHAAAGAPHPATAAVGDPGQAGVGPEVATPPTPSPDPAPQEAAAAPVDLREVLSEGNPGAGSSTPAPLNAPVSLWSAVFGTRPRASPSQPGPVSESVEGSGWAPAPRSSGISRPSVCQAQHPGQHRGPPTISGGPVCEAYQGGSSYDGDSEDEGVGRTTSHGQHDTRFSALYHQPLKSTEADREAALLGGPPEPEEEEQQGAKRLCVRWLDELILALWHDLQAYMDWQAQNAEVAKSHGTSLAAAVLGLGETAGSNGGQSSQAPAGGKPGSLPQVTAGDWLRRGLLAERLFHDAEALLAFRCCNLLSGFNLIASTAIMRMAAEARDPQQALQSALCTLAWHASKAPASVAAGKPSGSKASQQHHVLVPRSVRSCVGHLLARQEPAQLQAVVEEVAGQKWGAAMTGVTAEHKSKAVEMLSSLLKVASGLHQ